MNRIYRNYLEWRLGKINSRLSYLSSIYNMCIRRLEECPDMLTNDNAVGALMEHDKLVPRQNRLVAKLTGVKNE